MTDEEQADPGASAPAEQPAQDPPQEPASAPADAPAPAPAPVIAWGVPPSPAVPPPPVEWAPAPPEGLGISIGPVLRDTFARYAADPIRLFLIGLIPAFLVLIVSTSTGSTALVTILSIIATAITMVLGDRGPRSSLRAAVGLGVRRILWVYAVSLGIGLAIILVAVLPVFLISKTAATNIGLALVLGLLLAIPLLWVYSRLILALPAVVIDDVGAGAGFDRAREATRRLSAAVQVIVIVFIAGLASAPVSFAAGVLIETGWVPTTIVYLVGGALTAFVAPVGALAYVSMYRRAHPRYEEPELRPAVAIRPDDTPTRPRDMFDVPEHDPGGAPVIATPRPISAIVEAPAYGRLARAIAGTTLTLGIASVVLSVWTIGTLAAGSFTGSTNGVRPGTIAFGSSSSLATCTVLEPFTSMPTTGQIVWIGAFAKRTKPSDSINLVVKFNGTEIVNETQTSGTYDCLGTDQAETGLSSGLYDFTLTVNGAVSSHGVLVVRPAGSS